jgi:hypothetical protein
MKGYQNTVMFIFTTTVLTSQLISCSELYTPEVHLPHP